VRINSGIIVNAATIFILVGIGALCVKEAYPPASSVPETSRARESQIGVGKQLPQFAKYDWHSHKETLLLALRDGCHYCIDSAPFYRKLAELEGSDAIGNAHILAVFPDSHEVVSKLLESEQLKVESIPSVDFQVLGISGTPTAALVDQAGKVLAVWVGELNTNRQQTLLDKLRSESQQ
jgi:thiol-disulfide isomerase/thioredoxin